MLIKIFFYEKSWFPKVIFLDGNMKGHVVSVLDCTFSETVGLNNGIVCLSLFGTCL